MSTYRGGNELIEVLLRSSHDERSHMELLASLAVPASSGQSMPLSRIDMLECAFEDIWARLHRRDRRGMTPPAVRV